MKLTTIRILFIILQIALLVRLYAEAPNLFDLVKDGTPEAVQKAIREGADVNARVPAGWTALMWAAGFNKNPEVIQVLLDAGAKINAHDVCGSTALMFAVDYNENPEIIQVLLKAGAEVDARNGSGMTALFGAVSFKKKPEVIQMLLKAGADINARTEDGITVLMWVTSFNENPESIRTILEAGANPNARAVDGKTALMNAAILNENPEIILVLLEAGADATVKDNEGKTAWDFAETNEKLKGTDAYWKLNDARFETESSGVSEMLGEFDRRVDEGRKQETDTETPTTDGKTETDITADSPFQLEWDELGYEREVLHIEEVDLSNIKDIEAVLLKVRAEILIDPSGRISSVTILESSGNTEVDTVVRMALYLWQFASVSEEKATIKGIITYTIIGTKR